MPLVVQQAKVSIMWMVGIVLAEGDNNMESWKRRGRQDWWELYSRQFSREKKGGWEEREKKMT
jgi:hypothetical protein